MFLSKYKIGGCEKEIRIRIGIRKKNRTEERERTWIKHPLRNQMDRIL